MKEVKVICLESGKATLEQPKLFIGETVKLVIDFPKSVEGFTKSLEVKQGAIEFEASIELLESPLTFTTETVYIQPIAKQGDQIIKWAPRIIILNHSLNITA